MAITLNNNKNIATYTFQGNSIKLQGSFAALEALKQDIGSDPVIYVGSALYVNPEDPSPFQSIDAVKNVIYHLQIPENDEELAPKSLIGDWLFSDIEAFFDNDNIFAISLAFNKAMGRDIADKIAEYKANEKAEKKEQEPVASTHSTPPSVT